MINIIDNLFGKPKECYILGFGGFDKINPLHIKAILLLPNKELAMIIMKMDDILYAQNIDEITQHYKHNNYNIALPHNVDRAKEDLSMIQSFLHDVYIHNPKKLINLPMVFLPYISKIVNDHKLNLNNRAQSLTRLFNILRQENFSHNNIDYSAYMMVNLVANNTAYCV